MTLLRHWKLILGLLAIFVAGIFTGVILTVGGIKRVVTLQANQERWVKSRLTELDHGLKLSTEQKSKITPALEQSSEKFKGIVRESFVKVIQLVGDTHQTINKELTPDQQKTFEKIRVDNLRRWEEFAKKEANKAPPKPM